MSRIAGEVDEESYVEAMRATGDDDALGVPLVELLMVALPHHQERVRPIVGSSNQVLDLGCGPTIHGHTCPVRVLTPYHCLLAHE